MFTKLEMIDEIIALVRERVPGGGAADAEEFASHEEFVRQYHRWILPEDLAEREVTEVYEAVRAHWELARERTPGRPKVRVYDPEYEGRRRHSARTVIEIVNDDMPFLVDSVTMELNRLGYGIWLLVHPVMRVRRDAAGRIRAILPAPETAVSVNTTTAQAGTESLTESLIRVEFEGRLDPEAARELRGHLYGVLAEVRAAVEDWPSMRGELTSAVAELGQSDRLAVGGAELEEARAFLRWIDGGNFVFLGYRSYERFAEAGGGHDMRRPVPGAGLGIMRETSFADGSHSGGQVSVEQASRAGQTWGPIEVVKANAHATVHRPVDMDCITVARYDESGSVSGERLFLGLFTASAYSSNPRDVPLLRRKVGNTVRRAAFPYGSHSEKALLDVLEGYPKDELFQISEDELYQVSTGILSLQGRQRVGVFIRGDSRRRFFTCLVYLPRDRYGAGSQRKIEQILKAGLGGASAESEVKLSESVLARLRVTVYTRPDASQDFDAAELERQVDQVTRRWEEKLRGELIRVYGGMEGEKLSIRYREAFGEGYREDFSMTAAVRDVVEIEKLASDNEPVATLYRPVAESRDQKTPVRLRLFRAGQAAPLSEVLHVLENMGVRVSEQRPYEVRPTGLPTVWVYDFGLVPESRGKLEVEGTQEIFADAFAATWRGEAENDGFNQLVLRARLNWREISVLRAYCKYLRQAGSTFSQSYMESTLSLNPQVARLLVDLFEARFDPERRPRAVHETERLSSEIEEALDGVESLDEDRILRSFLDVTLATLRTNYFQRTEDGQPKGHISFKFDPQEIPELPLPRPAYEIFVYSPRVEGIHLRGGRVARGGIRFSDRREDFRTEVLGLMKAQMAKNAVIVPVGAKGGFVVKQSPEGSGRETLAAEVEHCYRTLIRGMLDVTDNRDPDGSLVPPPNVVRHDGDDPYLVVAADKGTATFSDIANAISVEEYGFWLGDAFASGGETGYDHKRMGITARGAWESVRRHLDEMGLDPDLEDFTVVGIGDMSGDVFGNAMLLSRHTKLLGAFDHRHIFIDPDPDPDTSFAERQRLFELSRSSWEDYTEHLVSEGGGVFSRKAKSVPLSPQAREFLGVEAERLTPDEVIGALLKADVDLLFNGGVGTYVKASDESNADVGDRANDHLRVDAAELRCRVVGEGGNLGFTQRGRIEFALSGGRINTDAIDNSAGVDASDHEVNIKILLDAVVASGDVATEQRNGLLVEMTGEVAELVLRDNREQNRALANATYGAASMAYVHARYLHALEAAGKLDRGLEFLPDDEALSGRTAAWRGLTLPELAVLLAYTKTGLYDALLASDAPDDSHLSHELERYFPRALRERFTDRIRAHPLGREILATSLANEVVNRAGTTFVFRLVEETGASEADVVRAYAAGQEIFGMRYLWARLEALEGLVAPEVRTRAFLQTRRYAERATRWLLRNRRPPLDVAAAVNYFSPVAAELSESIQGLLPASRREALRRESKQLAESGLPEDLAWELSTLEASLAALDIADICGATGEPTEIAAAVYFALGERLRLDRLRTRIEALPREDLWQTLARAALRDDLDAQQAALAAEVLRVVPAGSGSDDTLAARLEAWAAANHPQIERTLRVSDEIEAASRSDSPSLSVAAREVRNLVRCGMHDPAPSSASYGVDIH